MASVNNGGEDDTHHLFEHDPVFNEGPWDVHRVSKMDVVICGAMHLQTKDGDVDDVDDGDGDDDDDDDDDSDSGNEHFHCYFVSDDE